MLTRMKSGAHRSVLYGWKPSTFDGWTVVNIILGKRGEIHPRNPGNPAFRGGNFPLWPYGECLKFPIFALPHMSKSSCSWLELPWEFTPLSHVGKASRAPCVKAVALKSQGYFFSVMTCECPCSPSTSWDRYTSTPCSNITWLYHVIDIL